MKKLLLIIFLTIFPVLAHGATYYVAKTGSNNNPCSAAQSQSTPKLTINAGTQCLRAGDTLIVKAGTYVETLNASIPNGTVGNYVTVQAKPGETVIIQSNQAAITASGSPYQAAVVFSNNRYIIFDGFVIDLVNMPQPPAIIGHSAFGIILGNIAPNDHITVQNCEIKNSPYSRPTFISAFYTGQTTTNSSIIHNHIHDLLVGGDPHNSAYGIYFHGQNNNFSYNHLHGIAAYGIHMYSGGVIDNHNNIISNNVIHNTGNRGILVASSTNALVYNNIVYGAGGEGIYISFGGSGARIYNNTLYGNKGSIGIMNHSGAIIRNNISWQNNNDMVADGGTGTTIDHNLMGVNPLFVDATKHDFHLQASSPAINTGVVTMPGQQYNGSAPDLGAFEFGAGGRFPAPTSLRFVVN